MIRLRQLLTWFRRSRLDDDVRREVGFHLQAEIDQRVARGMPLEEARRTALRDFGGVDRVCEEVRDVRGITFWDQLVQDLRFGVRTLRRSPGYTFAAMLILALGIGANTAIFSVIDGVLLKPLPFRDGNRLVLLQQSALASNRPNVGPSIPEVFEYRKRLESVKDLVEYHGMSFTLLNQGDPDSVATGVVSANFFDMLGITPILGRSFVAGDDALGADAVLILSYQYWQSKFGGDRSVIGRVLEMNNRPHTVVGVLPDFPQYPRVNDVYMPTSACPYRSKAEADLPKGGFRSFSGLRVVGRLAPGANAQQASSEIATVAASFAYDHDEDYQNLKGFTGRADSLETQLTTGARPMLIALGDVTMLVLLIACANVANLALARTIRRERELSLRTALGATRARLFRQLVTESVVLALAGGVVGLGLAALSLDLLVGFVGRFTTRTGQIDIDAGVLWFAFGTAVLTGLAFGAAPALAMRRTVAQSVRDGGAQSGESRARHRLRGVLVVAQVAVSFVLVVGAALLLESFYRLATVPLGYEARQVMSANISGNFTKLGTRAEDARRIQGEILRRLRASPGVRSAAVTNSAPLAPNQNGQQLIRLERAASGEPRPMPVVQSIGSSGFFETLGTPIIAGRAFRESDSPDTPLVAVINVSMAKLWEGADPVGTRFRFAAAPPPGQEVQWITVVGVVGDFHFRNVDQDIEPEFYVPYEQVGFAGQLLVRTDGRPSALVPIIRAAVRDTDDQIPVTQVQTLEELKGSVLAPRGLTAALLSIFAGVALLITLAGIAGVIGTSVSQRTREFGLRMALGASRGSVLALVLRQGLVLVVAGIAIGLGGAYLFSHVIAEFLFATTPTDVAAYAVVAVLFLAAVVLATLGPARRATTIDPLAALRSE